MRPNTERRVLATELTDSETRHCQCRRFVKSRVNELDERALKATSDQTRELTADELDQIAGGTPSIPIPPPAPNVTVNGGPVGFVAPLHVARS